jgi:hypothetical protein
MPCAIEHGGAFCQARRASAGWRHRYSRAMHRAVILTMLVTGCVTRASGTQGPNPRCTTSYTLPVAHTVAASIAVLGALAVALDPPVQCDGDSGLCPMVFAFSIAALPTFAVFDGLYAAGAYQDVHRCKTRQAAARADLAREHALQQRRATRQRAWELTQQAQLRARAGECDAVLQVSTEVRELDSEFYESVFARDVAIGRCFAATNRCPAAVACPPVVQ